MVLRHLTQLVREFPYPRFQRRMVAAKEDCGFLEYDLVSRSMMRKLSSLSCFSRLACRERQVSSAAAYI
jgi:hypothetical protein